MGQQHVGTKSGLANGSSRHENAMPAETGHADTLTHLPQLEL
jgi:hypothetical protein